MPYDGFVDYGSVSYLGTGYPNFAPPPAGWNWITPGTIDSNQTIQSATTVRRKAVSGATYWNAPTVSEDYLLSFHLQVEYSNPGTDSRASATVYFTEYRFDNSTPQTNLYRSIDPSTTVTYDYDFTDLEFRGGDSRRFNIALNTSYGGAIQITITNFQVTPRSIAHQFYTPPVFPTEMWVGGPPIEVPAVDSNSTGAVHFVGNPTYGDGRLVVVDGKLQVAADVTQDSSDIVGLVQDAANGVAASGGTQSGLIQIYVPSSSHPMGLRHNTDLQWVLTNNDSAEFLNVAGYLARTALPENTNLNGGHVRRHIANHGSQGVVLYSST